MTHGSMRVQAQPLAATSQSAVPPGQVLRQPSERIHYLDWLRVLALLGVFLYHAVHPFDTLDWHVKNAEQSELITGLLVFFYPWGLGLFFLLAGAGACFSLRSRSAGGYASERVSRLLVPLLVAWVLLAPLQGFIEGRHQGTWRGSFLRFIPRFFDEATQWAMSWPSRPHPMVLAWAGHLWFLIMLLWFAILALPIFLALRAPSGRRITSWLAQHSQATCPVAAVLGGQRLRGLDAESRHRDPQVARRQATQEPARRPQVSWKRHAAPPQPRPMPTTRHPGHQPPMKPTA